MYLNCQQLHSYVFASPWGHYNPSAHEITYSIYDQELFQITYVFLCVLMILPGLCNPEVKMLELHKREICSGGLASSDRWQVMLIYLRVRQSTSISNWCCTKKPVSSTLQGEQPVSSTLQGEQRHLNDAFCCFVQFDLRYTSIISHCLLISQLVSITSSSSKRLGRCD